MIGSYNSYFHEALKARIEKDRLERADGMARGMCGDFADYRYAVGFVDGMNRVLELADDIKKEHDAA